MLNLITAHFVFYYIFNRVFFVLEYYIYPININNFYIFFVLIISIFFLLVFTFNIKGPAQDTGKWTNIKIQSLIYLI